MDKISNWPAGRTKLSVLSCCSMCLALGFLISFGLIFFPTLQLHTYPSFHQDNGCKHMVLIWHTLLLGWALLYSKIISCAMDTFENKYKTPKFKERIRAINSWAILLFITARHFHQKSCGVFYSTRIEKIHSFLFIIHKIVF